MLDLEQNKMRIAQQFSRAASTYDSAADVQLDIAFDALSLLDKGYKTGLDIGCGTGRISRSLVNKCSKLIAMDLAFGMLDFARQHHPQSIGWIQGDADDLPIAANSVDMLFSSMALQWVADQEKVMAEINRVMKKDATAVLAIMCEGSFEQLKATWRCIDEQPHVNDFASGQSWVKAAQCQGLKVKMFEKQYFTWHANIRQLLGSIKGIGANVVLSQASQHKPHKQNIKHPLNRDTFRQLEYYYQQQFAKKMQLPLTYQVCFLHCSK